MIISSAIGIGNVRTAAIIRCPATQFCVSLPRSNANPDSILADLSSQLCICLYLINLSDPVSSIKSPLSSRYLQISYFLLLFPLQLTSIVFGVFPCRQKYAKQSLSGAVDRHICLSISCTSLQHHSPQDPRTTQQYTSIGQVSSIFYNSTAHDSNKTRKKCVNCLIFWQFLREFWPMLPQ